MKPHRLITGLIAAASFATLLLSGYALAQRIAEYHEDNPRPLFYAIRTDKTEFRFAGRDVEFEEELDAEGEGTVTLHYGDETLEMPVEVPKPFDLPGLDRHLDWMHVYFFAENEKREDLNEFRGKIKSGETPYRVVVVVRRRDPGTGDDALFDVTVPEQDWGWAEVMRHRWSFTFHELKRDGGIESHTLEMPESGASYYRRRVQAYKAGEPPPEREPDELKEGTWEWDIALRTMPRPPAITKENQALLNAGWTLPVASGSAVVLLLSLGFAFAPERRRQPDPTA